MSVSKCNALFLYIVFVFFTFTLLCLVHWSNLQCETAPMTKSATYKGIGIRTVNLVLLAVKMLTETLVLP